MTDYQEGYERGLSTGSTSPGFFTSFFGVSKEYQKGLEAGAREYERRRYEEKSIMERSRQEDSKREERQRTLKRENEREREDIRQQKTLARLNREFDLYYNEFSQHKARYLERQKSNPPSKPLKLKYDGIIISATDGKTAFQDLNLWDEILSASKEDKEKIRGLVSSGPTPQTMVRVFKLIRNETSLLPIYQAISMNLDNLTLTPSQILVFLRENQQILSEPSLILRHGRRVKYTYFLTKSRGTYVILSTSLCRFTRLPPRMSYLPITTIPDEPWCYPEFVVRYR